MKRIIALFSFGLLSVSLCAGQSKPAPGSPPAVPTPQVKPAPAPKPLTVKQILKNYRKAMGSTFKKSKITSTVALGKFEITTMGVGGTVEIYSKAPNKQLTITVLNGLGTFNNGFDGVEAWSEDPISGLRSKTGTELAQAKVASIFDRDAELETLYPKMETKGTANFDGHTAYVVIATSADAGSETWYFDALTFMLIRQDSVAESPQGKIPAQEYFEDFRTINGIKVPFVTRVVNSSYTAIVKLTDVKTNVAIDDAKFAKPKAP